MCFYEINHLIIINKITMKRAKTAYKQYCFSKNNNMPLSEFFIMKNKKILLLKNESNSFLRIISLVKIKLKK
jgi:hypothetical protein